jgi:hypothetical protein
MNRPLKLLLSAVVLFSILAVYSPLQADVQDAFCYLEADSVDVYVIVWEEDRYGNKGRQIWNGIIRQGRRVRIPSRTGSIRYSETIYLDKQDALSGDTSRWCSDAASIGVP